MEKKYWIPLTIVLILVAIRIALPFWIENVVNDKLENISGYTGSIQDVDLHLYRGAYTVDSLIIDKVKANNTTPFVSASRIDFSVEWGALFNGAFVGEIVILKPIINFVAPDNDEGEFGQNVDWVKLIKDMIPIQINRFAINDGTVRFLDFSTSPQVDLPLNQLQLEVLNISNAENSEKDLPTHIELSATSIGQGQLSLIADAYLLKQIPDLDAALELEEVNLPDLNNFLDAYAKVDAESGVFNLYSEIVVKDAQIDGYVKPILNAVKILDLEKDEGNVFQVAWEGIVAFVSEAFENQPANQFATEVPLSGNLENIDTAVFPAIWNVFRNAFIEAFKMQTNDEVEFGEE